VLARGPNVFHGYHHLPQKTKKAIENGWFRTGDLGYIDRNGFLHLGGRASSMIVLEGGENINPEDLEGIYSEAKEVAEIGILAESGKLVALAVPDRSVLRGHPREEVPRVVRQAIERRGADLATYKRLSHVEITREALPTTRLGKIKRHLLAERYEAARRDEGGAARRKGPVAVEQLSGEDRTLLENPQARKMWDLLSRRYPDRRLTPEANLGMDLGIDSLEWVELSLSAGEKAGIAITEDLIERADTVRDLLEAAASAGGEELGEGKRPIESPEEVLSRSDRRWAQPNGPILTAAARVLFRLLRALLTVRGCRVTIRGRENLPEKGPFIVVPNHVSFLDSPVLTVAFGSQRFHRFFWAGQGRIMFVGRFRRLFSRLFQVVPIDPSRGPLSSLAVGALVVKEGHPLVWFAEGQVSQDGQLHSFQPGIGLIVNHYEPTVVPAFIQGTYEAMPLGKKLPRARRITVHFGKPIEGKKLKSKAGRLKKGEVHQRIAQVLHDELAELAQSVHQESEKGHDQAREAA
jgi:long-chain acyl-CoA synthetase